MKAVSKEGKEGNEANEGNEGNEGQEGFSKRFWSICVCICICICFLLYNLIADIHFDVLLTC